MRILYFVPRYWPSVGGAQNLARSVVQHISTRHEVWVITQFTADTDSFVASVANPTLAHYVDHQVPVQRIGPAGLWQPVVQSLAKIYGKARPINPLFAYALNQSLVHQLVGILHEFRPDIVHAVHIGLVYSSETAFAAAHKTHIPFVWTPVPHIEGGGWSGKRFRRLYRCADALVAMTNQEKQWLIGQGAAGERVHIVPPGLPFPVKSDAQWFRKKHRLGQSPLILFLGQKLPYKGYQQLAEAAPLVWADNPEVRFVFVGPRTPGSENFFSTFSDPRILEMGGVDEMEKNAAFAACDIFCMPSTQESLGIVYLEAWNYCKPVVAARIDTMKDVIDAGIDGLLVEKTPEAIANALLQLLRDPQMRRTLGENGYTKVRQQYNWGNRIQQLEAVYTSLAA
ncbi:MAG: glycosyltransferase family 4 protein [Caldilineaceae bacterium]